MNWIELSGLSILWGLLNHMSMTAMATYAVIQIVKETPLGMTTIVSTA